MTKKELSNKMNLLSQFQFLFACINISKKNSVPTPLPNKIVKSQNVCDHVYLFEAKT